jgi:simple sugar transport system permease protein
MARPCWRWPSPCWSASPVLLLGKDPVKGCRPSSGSRSRPPTPWASWLKATPLLLIALGLAVCFRSNVWNIGAEGQFVIGAVAAGGMALLADKTTGPWIVPAILLAGMLGGMVWAGIVALLRDRFNANEILVSLMLVYVARWCWAIWSMVPGRTPWATTSRRPRVRARHADSSAGAGHAHEYRRHHLAGGRRPAVGFLFRTRAGFAAGRRPGAGGGALCRLPRARRCGRRC